MQCERCAKKKATVFYRENLSGRIRALRLCSDCADVLEQAGELEDLSDPLSGKLSPLFPGDEGGMLPAFRRATAGGDRSTGKKCPQCGAAFGEICGEGLLGCAHCYVAFAEEMEEVVKATHGGATHRGRVSSGHQDRLERTAKLHTLRKLLREAVAAEAYETAAELRDEIRTLEATL